MHTRRVSESREIGLGLRVETMRVSKQCETGKMRDEAAHSAKDKIINLVVSRVHGLSRPQLELGSLIVQAV
jgi:hypothetical protein